MPSQFNRYGISFQYPDNWLLEEEEFEDLPEEHHSITVFCPSGAFWSVMVHPLPNEPTKLATAALKAMKQEYEQLEVEPIEETVEHHTLTGFDLQFFCLDLVNTSRIRSFRTSEAAYTLLCQAEDREFETLQNVFKAIEYSLLRGLPPDASST